jgi:hypothetical protein
MRGRFDPPSPKLYVPIESLTEKDFAHSDIQCYIEYIKLPPSGNRDGGPFGGPCLFLRAGDEQEGYFRFAMMSPADKVMLESNWKRDNTKKVEAIRTQTFDEIKNKRGPGWDAVVAFMKKHNFKAKEVTPT